MSEYSKTALSWLGLRDALLYFPYVIPFFEEEHMTWVDQESRIIHELTNRFLPPDLPEAAVDDLRHITDSLRALTLRVVHKIATMSPDPDLASVQSIFADVLRSDLSLTVREPMISFFVHYKPASRLPLIVSDAERSMSRSEDVTITIASLKLIDTRIITLEQLIEFRKDHEAMDKLRRLRLFAYQNYQGQSKDYTEDDIHTRITDYEHSVKKWGFTTASGAITTLLNSSLIAGGVAGSFLTAYLNAPLPAIASAMTATGLAIANMAVSLGQQRFAQKELMANNPVSYISYAKDKLESK